MTLGASFHCCSFSATRHPLVTRWEGRFNGGRRNMVSSKAKNGFNCVSCGTRPWKSPRSNWVFAFSDIFWTDRKDALCDNYHIVNATAELVSYRRIGRHTRFLTFRRSSKTT